ncbi:DUF4336 domain-containing protein [Mesorhizobium sp. B2-8-3]|uniref:DUF4336 domain-containing protein n=1 Tax=Mesorhizobium sp. B2-8-3 TaxID=2589905 RepID=UPI001FF012A5|nr:DUF4336 domain-containing protein [Mesorhizobium sp. B2-8-3]
MSSDPHQEPSLEPYAPVNVLKPVAPDIWIVDGSEITLVSIGLKLPFTTRMTVIRLSGGDLILHSPVEYSPELRTALEALGPIRFLVAPNSLHYWWIPDWKAQLPEAKVFAVPGLEKRAKRPVQVDQALMDRQSSWPDEIDLLVIKGDVLTEAVFFHRLSKTLILTDLIENFELNRIHSWFFRLLVRLSGAADPDGKAPIDMQLTFFRSSQALRKRFGR